MKSTACRHKLAAIAIASGATLAIAGGTAFATPGEQVKDPDEHAPKGTVDSKNASLAIGAAQIDQNSGVTNFSAAATNSGFNSAHNGVDQGNATGQNCSANTSGGGTLAVGLGTRSRDEGRASTGGTAQANGGNTGGDCSNDATSSNSADPIASIETGAASASNQTSTTVGQTNSGGVGISSDNTGSVDPSGARRVHQSGGSVSVGLLSVSQSSTVDNTSVAFANSGFNRAGNHVDQSNGTSQGSTANTSGGTTGALGLGGNATANGGNTGGSAANSSHSSNSANPTASITTGAASASNSTTTNVTQTNSGGVTVQSSNSGSVGK